MNYLSVCSGIEAATVAWKQLNWSPVGFSEIEPFPCAVLKHHYPGVTNYGDLTKNQEWGLAPGSIDLLVGGTPCQSFSCAGLRKGLADPRGNLALVFFGLADRLKPKWIVWENVPGVLSSSGGRDFGAFLGALGQLGYGFAYRVLDAQFFGVPQRRRRVFLVGYLGDWRRAAAVLFEREGVRGNPPKSQEKRKDIAPTLAARTKGGGGLGTDFDLDGGLILSPPSQEWSGPGFIHPRQLRNSQSSNQLGIKPEAKISDALTSEGPGAVFIAQAPSTLEVTIPIDLRQTSRGEKNTNYRSHGSGGAPGVGVGIEGDPAFTVSERNQAVFISMRESGHGFCQQDDVAGTLDASPGTSGHGSRAAIVFTRKNDGSDAGETSPTMRAMGHDTSHANAGGQLATVTQTGRIRRLTPRECEFLQGFSGDYTQIPWRGKPADQCPDGPRYKALGNSFAVPVVRWIGERIQKVEEFYKI